jgi:hypothetical protein
MLKYSVRAEVVKKFVSLQFDIPLLTSREFAVEREVILWTRAP